MAKVYSCINWFPEVLEKVRYYHEMKIWEEEVQITRDVLINNVTETEGVIAFEKFDAELMDNAPKLRVISNYGVGYDGIDVASATKRNILVGNTPEVLSETTADLAFGLILASARHILEGDAAIRKGKWKHLGTFRYWGSETHKAIDVHHSTLGIIGLGRIGSLVAKRAKACNMRVIYYDFSTKPNLESLLDAEFFSDLKALLSEADIISIHTPLTNETRNLIGTAEFAAMKPLTILINTARSQIVDQEALYEALKSKRIHGAALDVFEVEPISPDHPLLTLDNVIVTPHIGSATYNTRKKMMEIAVDNLLAGLSGERMPYCLNPSVYNKLTQ